MKSPAASANLSDLPVLKVLARARAEGRMPHAVLLTGADGAVLANVAEQLAALHLGDADPLGHPDCRVLRPAKKSRRISIDNTLEVVAALRLSSLSPHRVVIVNEPDRFQSESANAFLKTLEEPPLGTLIILQTTNYYRVLPTILSRCLRFHVAGDAPVLADPSWNDWLREMEKLLARMVLSLIHI
jgi:DNA polymerase-3 subunit delta'